MIVSGDAPSLENWWWYKSHGDQYLRLPPKLIESWLSGLKHFIANEEGFNKTSTGSNPVGSASEKKLRNNLTNSLLYCIIVHEE